MLHSENAYCLDKSVMQTMVIGFPNSPFDPKRKCSLPHRTTGVESEADIAHLPIEAFLVFRSNSQNEGLWNEL
jgi:hypothetical protein